MFSLSKATKKVIEEEPSSEEEISESESESQSNSESNQESYFNTDYLPYLDYLEEISLKKYKKFIEITNKYSSRPEVNFEEIYPYSEKEYNEIFEREEQLRNNFNFSDKYIGLKLFDFKLFLKRTESNNSLLGEILPPSIRTYEERERYILLMDIIISINYHKIVFAGGSVLDAIFDIGSSDYDIFLHSMDEYEAIETIKKIIERIESINGQTLINFLNFNEKDRKNFKDSFDDKSIKIERSENAITINLTARIGFISKNIKFQIILKLYSGPSEIIHGFDIDSCCVLFDSNFYMTERAEFAMKTWYNTVNFKRLSPSYSYRMVKYGLRGFAIYIPNFDHNKINYEKVDFEIKLKNDNNSVNEFLSKEFNIDLLFGKLKINSDPGIDKFLISIKNIDNLDLIHAEVIEKVDSYLQNKFSQLSKEKEILLEKRREELTQIRDDKTRKDNLDYLIYYSRLFISRLKKFDSRLIDGKKIGYGYYVQINRYWKSYRKKAKFTSITDNNERIVEELPVTSDYGTYKYYKRKTVNEMLDIVNIDDGFRRINENHYNKLTFTWKGNLREENKRDIKIISVIIIHNHIEIDKLLEIPNEDYNKLMNNFDTSLLPQKIKFKTQNPGEQITNTFHQLILADNNIFYQSNYYNNN